MQAKGAKPAAGSPIQAGVLDVNKKDGIVDLCHESLLKQLSKSPTMKVSRILLGTKSPACRDVLVLSWHG